MVKKIVSKTDVVAEVLTTPDEVSLGPATMPLILTYLFAAAGAWCLFDPPSLVWPLPALVIALFAHITRRIRAATWLILIFSVLLAIWSVHEYHRAQDPEEMGIFILGFTPWFQLGVIVLVLGPLLSSVCWFFGPPWLNPTAVKE